jgi:hypothetical protein
LPGLPTIGVPVLIGTPPTFPTDQTGGADWTGILLGPPDASRLIISELTPGLHFDCSNVGWGFRSKCLADQTKADFAIFKITQRLWDPFFWQWAPGGCGPALGKVNQLEQVNLLIDTALDTGQVAGLLRQYPQLATVPKGQLDPLLYSYRRQNNAEIDDLLGCTARR